MTTPLSIDALVRALDVLDHRGVTDRELATGHWPRWASEVQHRFLDRHCAADPALRAALAYIEQHPELRNLAHVARDAARGTPAALHAFAAAGLLGVPAENSIRPIASAT